MKIRRTRNTHFSGLVVFMLCLTAMLVLVPMDPVIADSNQPTVEPSPEPTETSIPDPPTQASPSETPYPYPPTNNNPMVQEQTAQPPVGLSTTDRILLVSIAVASVLVVGMIVYLLFSQTRGEGLGD